MPPDPAWKPADDDINAVLRRELREFAICRLFLDDTVTAVDAGTNVGLYARVLARLVRRCICFEPLPQLHAALERSLPENCELHRCALSDHDGTAALGVPVKDGDCFAELASLEKTDRAAYANMFGLPRDFAVATVDVPLRKLDTVLAGEPVHFIKIDVEGHELAVLRGARGTLAAHRPVVYVEIEERHKPGSLDAITGFMTGFDYRPYFLDGRRLSPLSRFSLPRHQSLADYSRYVRNFLFLP